MPVTLANINRFSKFFTVEFGNKFATNYLLHCPPHLDCVAALPCEIKIANFVMLQAHKCKCGYFWTRKQGCFYPPHIRGPWHQNKWRALCGHAAETGDDARYLCNFWRLLHFSAGQCTDRPIGLVRWSRYCRDRFRLALLPICDLPTASTSTLLTTRCGV